MSNKTFNVLIREVHVLTRQVKAPTEEEALRLAHDGEGEELMVEYSHTLGKDETTIEDVTEECQHDPVWASAVAADSCDGIIDIICRQCGASGSTALEEGDINW